MDISGWTVIKSKGVCVRAWFIYAILSTNSFSMNPKHYSINEAPDLLALKLSETERNE